MTSMGERAFHRPVLCEEAVRFLAPGEGKTIVDGTVGLGGHAEAILRADPGVRLIGIDRDEDALAIAADRLAPFGDRVRLIYGNYRDIGRLLDEIGIGKVDGVLLDLGVSSFQLNEPERGFSFREDGPLDMRMDRSQRPTAAEWLAAASLEEIVDALRRFGEERYALRIARALVAERRRRPIATTGELRRIVHRAVPAHYFAQPIDPATRTFQAIRIAVNRELENLSDGLSASFERLILGGVLVVISFHSLEDRIVKRFLREKAEPCTCPPDIPECQCGKRVEVRILTRKPIVPSAAEIEENPRARSAKLRAGEKVV